MAERIQKLLAKAGYGSRRKCETLIRAGRVKVNGRTSSLGQKADPDNDTIEVDGHAIAFEKRLYIKLNKPAGVLSSTEDELAQGRPTVRDLVDVPGHLYPVGRLDKQSEGLILLTNDGELAHRLTHPRYGHEKLYRVEVEGFIEDRTLDHWRRGGIELDDRPTAPAKINVIERNRDHSILNIRLREGRKRQIRRIAAMLDHPVIKLTRLKIGPIRLDDVPTGEWRHLSEKEVALLHNSVAKAG
jgi:23S rRNA pseudouridine2605 synthase